MKLDIATFKNIVKKNNRQVDIESITMQSKLSDLGVDSIGFTTIVFDIEDKFGVEMDEKRLDSVVSVRDFFMLLEDYNILVE